MNTKELLESLNKDMAIALPATISLEEIQDALALHLNQLIKNDFEKLVVTLYRIDVSEQKLKQLLVQHPDRDAGQLIASLIIERQLQKMKTRRQFGQHANGPDEEEKW
jgi:hypothetical protein